MIIPDVAFIAGLAYGQFGLSRKGNGRGREREREMNSNEFEKCQTLFRQPI